MQTTMRKRCTAGVLPLLFTLAGCSEAFGPSTEFPRQPRAPQRAFTAQESQLADASVGFGLGLYREVVSAEERVNVMLSPLSASMALGMTMNGAQNATYDAMRTALGFGSLSEGEINEAYKGLIEQLLARAPRVAFELANSIWHEQTFAVKQPFIDVNRTYFDAEVSALDFGSPSAPTTISAWAERKTQGRIKDLIKSISPDEIMFLVNAVYFKAPWASKFEVQATRNGPFIRADGSSVSVPLMKQTHTFRWKQSAELTIVELPYADSAFTMVLMLPPEGTGLDQLEAKLTTEWWNAQVNSLSTGKIELTLPRFKFDYDSGLIPALRALGMGIAFGGGADFRRIADAPLYLSRVYQKTFVEANEAGTEAAAATIVGVGIVCACGPPAVSFTRPFLFAIRERETGALLFIGRVGDPS